MEADLDDFAADGRRRNARVVLAVLAVLAVFGGMVPLLRAGAMSIVVVQFVSAAMMLAGYWQVRRGARLEVPILILVAGTFAQHIAGIMALDRLSVIPVFAAVPVLIIAATLSRRWLIVGAGASLLVLGIEGALVLPVLSQPDEAGALSGGFIVIVLATALSYLHLDSVERAFAKAREREKSRDEALARQRELEQEVLKGQRMEALGRLAGGVAHDFNNLLAVVAGSAELIRSNLEDEDEGDEDTAMLDMMLEATQQGKRLTEQLLAFSKRAPLDDEAVDATDALSKLRPILESLAGRRVALEVRVPSERLDVPLSRARFEQIVMNLAVNARDAMGDGGALRIELASPSGDGGGDGHSCCLTVEDDGSGIDPEALEHIFEPFFTTKGDEGTGLGLATCYGIVDQVGGTISVSSEVGVGTKFTVSVPTLRE